MSINSIVTNPVILDSLKVAIGGGGGSGITSLDNTDNNVSVSVVGSVGTVNLEPSINLESLNILGTISLNSEVGNVGDVLTSQAGASPIWSPPQTTTGEIMKLYYQSNGMQPVAQNGATITLWTQAFNDLDITKKYLIRINAGYYVPSVGGVIGFGNVQLTNLTGVVQQYTTAYGSLEVRLTQSFYFTTFQPELVSDTFSILVNVDAGVVICDTYDYFNVEIDEINIA